MARSQKAGEVNSGSRPSLLTTGAASPSGRPGGTGSSRDDRQRHLAGQHRREGVHVRGRVPLADPERGVLRRRVHDPRHRDDAGEARVRRGCRRCTSASSVSGPSATTCSPSTRSASRARYVAASARVTGGSGPAPDRSSPLWLIEPVAQVRGNGTPCGTPRCGPAGDRHRPGPDGLEEVREQVHPAAAGHHAGRGDGDGEHVDRGVADEVGDGGEVVGGEVRVDDDGRRVRRPGRCRRERPAHDALAVVVRRRRGAGDEGDEREQRQHDARRPDGDAHGSTQYCATTPTDGEDASPLRPSHRRARPPGTVTARHSADRPRSQTACHQDRPADTRTRDHCVAEVAGRLEQPLRTGSARGSAEAVPANTRTGWACRIERGRPPGPRRASRRDEEPQHEDQRERRDQGEPAPQGGPGRHRQQRQDDGLGELAGGEERLGRAPRLHPEPETAEVALAPREQRGVPGGDQQERQRPEPPADAPLRLRHRCVRRRRRAARG